MAAAKPVPPKAAATAAKSGKKGKASPPAPRGPAAVVRAATEAAQEPLAEAKGLPGWRSARIVIGSALAEGDTAILLELRDKAVALRRRSGNDWQPVSPVSCEDPVAAYAALKKLAAPAPAGKEEAEFEVSARKLPRRACRVAARVAAKGEQVLVILGRELPLPERITIGRLLGWLVPPFLKRKPPVPERDPSLPRVELEGTGPDAGGRQETAAESDGYVPACDLVAAAVRDRAAAIVFEAGPQGVAVKFDVDGVARPAPPLDKAAVGGIVGVLKGIAGFDPKQRGSQTAAVVAMIEGKSWPCTVGWQRAASGERVEVRIDKMRPKFKTLADVGMPSAVIARVQEILKLESGLLLLATPRGGGLPTLFDGIVTAADRLLRDFVVLEDAAAPRSEIQNLRPVRWDSRSGSQPVAALDAALREYANVITTCDLEDADLAKRLVAQAGEGRLVIVGLRAADAADGIARLIGWGVDPQAVGRVLLGAVGSRLVRKLCPQCRQEFFPAVAALERLGLDPDVDVTLCRPARSGCSVCTGTGYLGRTAACELAAGPTLQAYVAKSADAGVLRKAAAKDGMVSVRQDAIAKAARGVTSVEEVQRVFQAS